MARVRQELVQEGQLSAEEAARRSAQGQLHKDSDEAQQSEAQQQAALADSADFYDPARGVRGSFLRGTQHLQREQERGLSAADRDRRTIRLMLGLLALGFAFWYFFLR